MTSKLIKSSARVRDLGEVFTPDFLVEQMLDQFPKDAWRQCKNWLEPTCGNGQFILGILRRKIQHGHHLLQALDTTFGADIMGDNVSECHVRIYREIVIPYAERNGIVDDEWKELRLDSVLLVENNIVPVDDSLNEDFGKWRHFAKQPKKQREGMMAKVQKILDIVDGVSNKRFRNATDKRLFRELSVFKRVEG